MGTQGPSGPPKGKQDWGQGPGEEKGGSGYIEASSLNRDHLL